MPRKKKETTVEREAKKPAPSERLSALDRVKLQRRIAAYRAGPKPKTWKQIATLEKRPERTLQYIYAQYEAERDILDDPLGIVEESLMLYGEGIATLSELASTPTDHVSARVGATRAMLEAVKGRLELLAATGRLPRRLDVYQQQRDAERILLNIAKVLERHDAEPGLLMELVAVLDGKEPGSTLEHAVIEIEPQRSG